MPHDAKYNPDIFRNINFPDRLLREKISYGSGVLGTHPFPVDIFDAEYVLTCMPFPSTETTKMAEKYNEIFLRTLDKYNLAAEFDMGDGTIFYAYERCEQVDIKEIETYMKELKEEDKKFPDMYSEVIDKYVSEHGLE